VGRDFQLSSQGETATERAMSIARLMALAGILWLCAHQAPPRGVSAPHVAKWLLMSAAAVGWLGWLTCRRLGVPARTTGLFLLLLAASGGVLAAIAPLAISFMAIAGLGAAIAFGGVMAIGVGAVGVATQGVTSLVVGGAGILVAQGVLYVTVAMMAGSSRHQYIERTMQAEQLLAERVRADAERDRAAALTERNRVGREVHDVLAHSLGALSVQLDAVDALLERGGDTDRARDLVQQARRLAVQGLEETRQAVHALRDEPVALAEQIATLAARDEAQLTVEGAPRPLAANAGLALYRAVQEAVTNARKHAPGALVSIRLEFEPQVTRLTVTNGRGSESASPSGLRASGGGFGLQGMRERIELLGGRVAIDDTSDDFRIEVSVPS
jgi:signal transduction histidine kinase